jgi:DNA repair exonuclease SbcCD nuclease subunit
VSTVRIAHISDTHLGYRALFKSASDGRNQRAADIEAAYATVVEDILDPRREIQLVIHSGDVFHQSRPSWSAIRCFIQQTRRLTEAGIPVVVIAGNHDTPRLRTTVTVFDILQLSLPEVHFVTRYEHETVEPL